VKIRPTDRKSGALTQQPAGPMKAEGPHSFCKPPNPRLVHSTSCLTSSQPGKCKRVSDDLFLCFGREFFGPCLALINLLLSVTALSARRSPVRARCSERLVAKVLASKIGNFSAARCYCTITFGIEIRNMAPLALSEQTSMDPCNAVVTML